VKQKCENHPHFDNKKELTFHQIVKVLGDYILNCVETVLVVQGDTRSRKEKKRKNTQTKTKNKKNVIPQIGIETMTK
jgi:hypothetical protein